mmetsp:Transcript_5869/g.12781  ORF Transcript_5869/g.12781 Transcript_5869/m.12781 type:complete len:335 (+) Transcript_5869:237-1241(+)
MEGEKIRLPFVIPPEGHTVGQVVGLVVRVPVTEGGLGEIQLAANTVETGGAEGVTAGLALGEDPALAGGVREQLGIPQAGLPDSCISESHVPVLLHLLPWVGKRRVVPLKIIEPGLPLGMKRVIGAVGVPEEVNDESIGRELAVTEVMQGVFDVGAVVPPPPGGYEPEGPLGWDPGTTDEVVVGTSACLQRRSRHQIQLKRHRKIPAHRRTRGGKRSRIDRPFPRDEGVLSRHNTQRAVPRGGKVMRHVRSPVHHQRGHVPLASENSGVVGPGTRAVQDLVLSRGQLQRGAPHLDGTGPGKLGACRVAKNHLAGGTHQYLSKHRPDTTPRRGRH